jgi:hypothetical protein
LLNLPTPLEAHKTIDNKIFLKAADIGQMLQVFKKEKERDLMKSRICKTSHGDYAPSGLTPPTYDIVKRRFEMTRINEDTFLPYKIRQVTEEILTLGQQTNPKEEGSGGVGSSSGAGGGGGGGGTKGPKMSKKAQKEQAKRDKEAGIHHDENKSENIRKIEKITEEIVDFEEWMVDPSNPTKGRTIIIDGKNWSSADAQLLIHHPELLITEEDMEEDELEELAKQQLRNKVAKQQQQSSSSSSQLTTGEQPSSSSSSTLPTLSINTNVLSEGEGTAAVSSSNNPIKLSFTLKRTPKNAPPSAAEGEELPQSGEEKNETTGEVEEDKYDIEDTSDNMEVDDAAMVADDDEENDEDEEEADESDEDDDDDLENLILQKANRTAELAGGTVTTASDAHVHVDHDDEEHGEMEITEESGVDHGPTSEDQVGLTVDDDEEEEEEEEEEWMKRV